jgi:hypothetical protein
MTKTVKIAAMVPEDVKAWLQERAIYHGSTLGAELSISVRLRMEREALGVTWETDEPSPHRARNRATRNRARGQRP